MAEFIEIGDVSVAIRDYKSNPLLTEWLNKATLSKAKSTPDIILQAEEDGIHLRWNRASGSPLDFHIDVAKAIDSVRSYPAPKQGAFNQALGKKTKHVIDATGGWGGDALLMCIQGYQVTIIERHPVMALMLEEAMLRLSQMDWVKKNKVTPPKVLSADAIKLFSNSGISSDCVYLDPMFPAKKKKSAAANKYMQLLQWMIGQDTDASELVTAALDAGIARVAVKRPDYAEPLLSSPAVRFSSKLVHYDVYLHSL